MAEEVNSNVVSHGQLDNKPTLYRDRGSGIVITIKVVAFNCGYLIHHLSLFDSKYEFVILLSILCEVNIYLSHFETIL